MAAFRPSELLRAGVGAVLGLTICTVLVELGRYLPSVPLQLVAPLGATAVLVFCVPNSPLAQPWSAVTGNIVSALVALTAILFIPAPWAIGVAVGGAIAAMMLMRALHPPGGAVALLAALDPEPVREAGVLFAFVPIGLTTATLVIAAIIYNRATRRIYPFRQVETDGERERVSRLGLSDDQLGDLLVRFNQSTNLGVADLGRLLAAAEEEAVRHRLDGTTCDDVMTENLITVRPHTPLPRLAKLFHDHAIKSIPVVDRDMSLRGIVLQADILNAMATKDRLPRWRSTYRRRRAADVMRAADRAVPHDLPVGALLERLAARGVEVVPVTRAGRLVGILTRSDIIRLLLRDSPKQVAD